MLLLVMSTSLIINYGFVACVYLKMDSQCAKQNPIQLLFTLVDHRCASDVQLWLEKGASLALS